MDFQILIILKIGLWWSATGHQGLSKRDIYQIHSAVINFNKIKKNIWKKLLWNLTIVGGSGLLENQ